MYECLPFEARGPDKMRSILKGTFRLFPKSSLRDKFCLDFSLLTFF